MNENVEVDVVDRQLACARIDSQTGREYIEAMGSVANYAFSNRSIITSKVRLAFQKVFPESRLDVLYDISHNMAKKEFHTINGERMEVLVHRKGASRALPPNHPDIPNKYRGIGQPIPVGGSMGTSSYILCGDYGSMEKTLGSSCHGAGRLLSRSESLETYTHEDLLENLRNQNIIFRCKNRKGLREEAPGAYKDVDRVVNLCEKVGISRKICKVRPIIVIKG
jgi:tRNA-splicing ligase RtcB